MRSRLIKSLNNRFYVKFMQLEIDLLSLNKEFADINSTVESLLSKSLTKPSSVVIC